MCAFCMLAMHHQGFSHVMYGNITLHSGGWLCIHRGFLHDPEEVMNTLHPKD